MEVEVKKELLSRMLADLFCSYLSSQMIDWEKEMNSAAIRALGEIRQAMHEYDITSPNEHEDWRTLEKVMNVLDKYNINTGPCRDF